VSLSTTWCRRSTCHHRRSPCSGPNSIPMPSTLDLPSVCVYLCNVCMCVHVCELCIGLYVCSGCSGTSRLLGAGKVPKMSGRNFGPRSGDLSPNASGSYNNSGSPRSPLRGSAKEILSPSRTFSYSPDRRPAVPDKDDRPVYGIKSTRNFITSNAVESILQGLTTSWMHSLWR
jgi:hypothetical protein